MENNDSDDSFDLYGEVLWRRCIQDLDKIFEKPKSDVLDLETEHGFIKIPVVTKEFMPEGMILLAPRTTDLTEAIDKHPFIIKNVQVVNHAKRKRK